MIKATYRQKGLGFGSTGRGLDPSWQRGMEARTAESSRVELQAGSRKGEA